MDRVRSSWDHNGKTRWIINGKNYVELMIYIYLSETIHIDKETCVKLRVNKTILEYCVIRTSSLLFFENES